MTLASTRCERQPSAPSLQLSAISFFRGFAGALRRMRPFSSAVLALACLAGWLPAQIHSTAPDVPAKTPNSGSGPTVSGPAVSEPSLALLASSTMNVASEIGGAFMSSSKCDADGNLYIRKLAMDRPLLSPVVKIDSEGKRVALFDPVAFSQLSLDRADAFSPASDGGIYQIAQSGVLKPRIYVLRFSSDGSPASPILLDADFEVYTFAAFADGNFLVSGLQRDGLNKNDRGRNFTAVFSADGRERAQLSLEAPAPEAAKALAQREISNPAQKDAEKAASTLDLAEAESGSDGNLYVMQRSSPALVYVIAPSGKVMKTIKVGSPLPDAMPSSFHVSGNQMALSFWNDESERQTVVVADAQTGRKIASYADPGGLGPSLACFSANEGVFTFLQLGEGNALEVIRAEAQ